MRPIGYYVHHHGDGHRQRALAVAAHHPDRFVLLGTGLVGRTGDIAHVDLPDDRMGNTIAFDGHDSAEDRPHVLHYAPLEHGGVRERMSAIAQWIAAAQPALIVVDVSVEVAMLGRLCSTPVAYVRLGGRRQDVPHLEAFRAASLLIAPFAEAFDDEEAADWVRCKTFYAPGIVQRGIETTLQSGLVLVVCGRGGSTLSDANLIAAARSTPNLQWRVIGLTTAIPDLPSNLVFAGWTDDPASEIARAEIVVGAAGDGLVGAVLAARRPFVCIPESRPFGEQVQKAKALQRLGAAILLDGWPEAKSWRDILASARRIDPRAQARLDDPNGALRLAQALIAFADGQK